MTTLLICGGLWALAAALCVLLPRLDRARRLADSAIADQPTDRNREMP